MRPSATTRRRLRSGSRVLGRPTSFEWTLRAVEVCIQYGGARGGATSRGRRKGRVGRGVRLRAETRNRLASWLARRRLWSRELTNGLTIASSLSCITEEPEKLRRETR